MTLASNMNIWSSRFASVETERLFQANVRRRNFRANVGGISFGLFLFVAFIFSDFLDSSNPTEAVAIRLVSFFGCLALLLLLTVKRFRQHHDLVVTIIVAILGLAINLIILRQSSLENNYYIGLIQGNILFGLLLRLNFQSMFSAVALTMAGFVFTASQKNEPGLALLQSVNLGLVVIICLMGIYLLQRYQREDFLRAQQIEEQNQQLSALLEALREDNKRKLAAMNTLVHFVKTPLHQISGFSDVVLTGLMRPDDKSSIDDSVSGARYIKDATTNLSKSINGLLAYHRLDETDGRQIFEPVDIDSILGDMGDLLPNDATFEFTGAKKQVVVSKQSLKAAIRSLAGYYADQACEGLHVSISIEIYNKKLRIYISDNLAPVSMADFLQDTQPLTKLDSYLNCAGSEMPMALRTVSRAVEIAQGSFSHQQGDAGNVFTISLGTDHKISVDTAAA